MNPPWTVNVLLMRSASCCIHHLGNLIGATLVLLQCVTLTRLLGVC